jgi:hypothetical protein
MAVVDHGDVQSQQCLTGMVILDPPAGIGATLGRVFVNGTAIRIRQVPGPDNRGVPLSDVDGRQARVCGVFIFDGNQVILSVTGVFPLLR